MVTFKKGYINLMFLLLLAISLNILFFGCDKYLRITERTDFIISALDYSDHHFFPDTIYKSSFVDFMNNASGNYLQSTIDNQIMSNDSTFEIWVQTEQTHPNKRLTAATTMLYEEPPGGYSDTLKSSTGIVGLHYFGYFRKLETWEYYIYPLAGMIGFKVDIPNNYHAAITYKINDGKKYGTNSFETNINDTLILKMFKTDDQSPLGTPLAWNLKLKNVYRLPVSGIFEEGFEFNIYYNSAGVLIKTIPNTSGNDQGLMEITHLDRYTGNTHTPPPDGVFDFLIGYTIDTSASDIIFPSLRPFVDNFVSANISSSYYFAELYSQSKIIARNAPNADKYFLKGYLEITASSE